MNVLYIVSCILITVVSLFLLADAVSKWSAIIQDFHYIVKEKVIESKVNKSALRAAKESIAVNKRTEINTTELFTFTEDEIPTVDEFPAVENPEDEQCFEIYSEVAD